MARRIKEKKKVDKNAWLNTYADMITLVLVFFILLYSISSIDQEKFKLIVKAFSADPKTLEQISMEESELQQGHPEVESGGVEGDQIADIPDLEALYKYLNEYVAANNLQESVQVEKGADFVYVRFMSTLFFEPDKAILKEGGKGILDFVGNALSGIEPNIKIIRVDGHTAEASNGRNTVDDRVLSTDRANAVLKYLEANYIKEPSKLIAVGYGMFRPVAPNDSEVNRAKNRRVEILIGKEDRLQDEIDTIFKKEEMSEE